MERKMEIWRYGVQSLTPLYFVHHNLGLVGPDKS